MVVTRTGRVEGSTIVFDEPLQLPEGAEVVVRIESTHTEAQDTASANVSPLNKLSFFGMWAGRPEMQDSSGWVRDERQRWATRQG